MAKAIVEARPKDELILNQFSDPPLQPGGYVLAGKTAADRDFAFLQQLAEAVPALAGAAPADIAAARKLQHQVLAIDLDTFPVGIPMNQISEDVAHGSKHSTLAHWTPDVAMPQVERIYPEEDRYMAEPTWENLTKIDEAVDKLWRPVVPIERLSKAKFRALMVFQHVLRGNAKGARQHMPKGNPFWEVADFGRVYASADAQFLGLPADVARDKSRGPSLAEQMRQIRLPWYWTGWTFDPQLVGSGTDEHTRGADYFTLELMQEGYPSHAAFMLARKMWGQKSPVPGARPWEMRFSFFLLGKPAAEVEPSDADRRELFRRVVGNIFCATALLLENEVKRTGQVVYKESTQQQLGLARAYLKHAGRPAEELFSRVAELVRAAKRWP